MRKMICAIYDQRVELYGNPFVALSRSEALRSFFDAVNDPGSPFGRHAEDYSLFHIGNYDDETGVLVDLAPDRMTGAIAMLDNDKPPQGNIPVDPALFEKE